MPFSYYLYKLLKPWFKAKLRLMIQRLLWEALCVQRAAPAKAPQSWAQKGLCGQVPVSLHLVLSRFSGFLDLGIFLILTQLLEKLAGQCCIGVMSF